MAAVGRFARFAAAGVGAATGLLTLAVARRADTASWAGRSIPAEVVLLLVGWCLVAAGLRLTTRPTQRTPGVLLTAGGFAWFVADWNNQDARPSAVFTAGLVLSTVGPALVGHAMLRYERTGLAWFDRFAVGAAYLGTAGLAGLLPTLYFDPAREGCAACAANLFALRSDPTVADRLGRAGVLFGPVWCALLVVAIARVLVRSGRTRCRLTAPTLIPGVVYLVVVGVTYRRAAGSAYVPVDPTTRVFWSVEGCLLAVTALGTLWPVVQRRLTRARFARLVVDIAGAPPLGGLAGVLARTLRDPSLTVMYRMDDDLVDAAGHKTAAEYGQAVTRLVRGGETVALLAHRPGLMDDRNLTAEIGEAARLVLDSERLQAQNRAQLQDLQASRARIVQSGDRERRRLERDLHDGAQQHLVALSLALQLAAIRSQGGAVDAAKLNRARVEVTTALAELRTLARGIYPRELADEGLAAALETLAESSFALVTIDSMPARRFPPAVEAAAYQVVAQSTKAAAQSTEAMGAQGVRVGAVDDGECLTIELVASVPLLDVTVLQDRVGALGGRFELCPADSGVRIRAVLPCA
jgi:signal transduction histidine kinase